MMSSCLTATLPVALTVLCPLTSCRASVVVATTPATTALCCCCCESPVIPCFSCFVGSVALCAFDDVDSICYSYDFDLEECNSVVYENGIRMNMIWNAFKANSWRDSGANKGNDDDDEKTRLMMNEKRSCRTDKQQSTRTVNEREKKPEPAHRCFCGVCCLLMRCAMKNISRKQEAQTHQKVRLPFALPDIQSSDLYIEF
jgi:hypothetical protein